MADSVNSPNDRHFCSALAPLHPGADEYERLKRQKGGIVTSTKWRENSEITILFMEGDQRLRGRVEAVAKEWTRANRANLTFKFVTSGESDIRIAFREGDGSWSYLGTDCQGIPKDQPTMNYGWLNPDSDEAELRRVVLHEFGHALGMFHEHQNSKGAIKWNKDAVYRDLSGPPNHWSREQIDQNMFRRYEDAVSTPADPDSIMMYPIPASWTLPDSPIRSVGLNNDLSPVDESFIASQYR